MDNDFYVEPLDKPPKDNFPKKTWILLAIIWVLCLIPIPFTGTIAIVMNFAALVMAIVVLVKGYVRNGVFQLLSVFILTPAFYAIGIIVGTSLIAHTLNTGNMSKQTPQEAFLDGLNNEVADLYKIVGKDIKSNNVTHSSLNNSKTEASLLKPKQNSQKKEQIITWYLAFTKEGGQIKCTDIVEKSALLILKTKSGVEIEIHKANILKIERYQTVDNKTQKSVWDPAKG